MYFDSDGTVYLEDQGSGSTGWALLPGAGGGDTTAKYLIGAPDAALTNAAAFSTLFSSPDIPPAVCNAMDDEFDGVLMNSPNNIWDLSHLGSGTGDRGLLTTHTVREMAHV